MCKITLDDDLRAKLGDLADEIALCDAVVRIPMSGLVESLNLSVATALVQFEVLRQNP